MAKRIALSIDGVTATAVLHEDRAPKASERFWNALPMEETLRHVRWSGNAGYFLSAALRDPAFPLENRCSMYAPGTINFRPEHGEVAIAYGEAQARDWNGNAWATRVATFEGDAKAFLEAVASTQHAGKRRLVLRRVE